MLTRQELTEAARAAADKKAAKGSDIDLSAYAGSSGQRPPAEQELGPADRERLSLAGMNLDDSERSASYLMRDASIMHVKNFQQDVEVLPLKQALEEHAWVREHYWRLVAVDSDKYTAAVELDLHDGYVIRAKEGARGFFPVQACMYMDTEGQQQNVHNIIIAEPGSELHVISGCATGTHLDSGAHLGVTEYYVGRDAKLSFTMIHNWAQRMAVRPRSAARVEAGGQFINNYISLQPVESLQTDPVVELAGPDAGARLYSILVGHPGTALDVGGQVTLGHAGNRAEVVSRAISNGGHITARGHLRGTAADIKAHLECHGLILNGGAIHAIPELEGHVDGVDMSHEAAVGKIAQEEIAYLMARGLDEQTATAAIVRGFLDVDMPGLPPALKAEIDRAVDTTNREAL